MSREMTVTLMTWLSMLAFVTLVLAGCAVAPPVAPPASPLPSRWQAALPDDSADRSASVEWWADFDDPAVGTLVGWADTNSPTLDKALAQIAIARATLQSSGAALQPTITGTTSLQRGRSVVMTGGLATVTTRSAGIDASWEIDLFGRLRLARDAAGARLDARTADWGSARVTLAAEVADDYAQYRSCRLLESRYAQQAASLAETERITTASAQAGFGAPADVDLAVAGASTGRATLTQQQTACDVLVKALVALTGASEPTLRQTVDARRDGELPSPPNLHITQVPADLLGQRADIVSAERTLAAASAEVGQAQANRFPSVTLNGSIGVAATTSTAALVTSAFGPSLNLPIFDGGARRAAVASARASFDSAVADYQGTLRTAIQEVEQALAQLDGAARRRRDASVAAARYARYFEAAQVHWRAGGIDLLTLEQSRRDMVTAQTTLIGVRLEQIRQYIALYKALGGGWKSGTVQSVSSATFDRTDGNLIQ